MCKERHAFSLVQYLHSYFKIITCEGKIISGNVGLDRSKCKEVAAQTKLYLNNMNLSSLMDFQ